MRKRFRNTLFLFISFFVLVSLACGVLSQADPTATVPPIAQIEEPVEEPTVEIIEPTATYTQEPTLTDTPEPTPTDTPEPTPTDTPEPLPTNTPEPLPTNTPEPQAFFIEEFQSDPGWYFEVLSLGSGNPSSVTYRFENERMIFEIPERQLLSYYIYEEYIYDSVRLDINLENRGVNSQGVYLVCNLSDEGWYELSIGSDGIWELYMFDTTTEMYDLLVYGGSTNIKLGREINEYTFICDGNTLSFYFNGVQPTGSPHVDRKYALRRGYVGFGVASYDSIPVRVEVDWFAITPP